MLNDEIKGPIQSVSRAAAILRCFYDNQELGIVEISKMIGLHKSTASTLVITLKNEQLLEQNPSNGRYRLGIGAFILGANTKLNIRTLSLPYLYSLNKQFNETVDLGIPDGSDIIYLNKIESDYSIRTCTRVGQRIPFYCTANGKAIFAYYEQENLYNIISNLDIKKFTENTISDPAKLIQELVMVKANGYACDIEEMESGLCCYASPIFDGSGTPVAAISLSGPDFRMCGETKSEMISALKASTAQLSKILSKSNYIFANNDID